MNLSDVPLDLPNNTFEWHRKPDNQYVYINKSSNDPRTILCELPKSISKGLSNQSPTKELFVTIYS